MSFQNNIEKGQMRATKFGADKILCAPARPFAHYFNGASNAFSDGTMDSGTLSQFPSSQQCKTRFSSRSLNISQE
jgi:hypothetical protein